MNTLHQILRLMKGTYNKAELYRDETVSEILNLKVEEIISDISEGKEQGLENLHRALYEIYICHFVSPWSEDVLDVNDLQILSIRTKLEKVWDKILEQKYESEIEQLANSQDFFNDLEKTIHNHKSGIDHELFSYLRESATLDDLREYIRQEGPFDLCFSDILCYLMPGIYGQKRIEIASNFWDEIGKGKEARTHRKLRISLMKALNIDEYEHIQNPAKYCWEELALANFYFKSSLNRKKNTQALGALLCVEMAVPGKMNYIYDGLKRVGLRDKDLVYVSEHSVVDIKHAQGWRDDVLTPLLEERPDLRTEVLKGVFGRLEVAGNVCDKLLKLMKEKKISSYQDRATV